MGNADHGSILQMLMQSLIYTAYVWANVYIQVLHHILRLDRYTYHVTYIYLCACKYTHLQSQRHPQTRNNNWGFLDRPSPNTPKLIRQIDLSQPSRPTYRCCIHLYPISQWIPINCLLLYSIAWFLKNCPHIMSSLPPISLACAFGPLGFVGIRPRLIGPPIPGICELYMYNKSGKKNTISNCKKSNKSGPNHAKSYKTKTHPSDKSLLNH